MAPQRKPEYDVAITIHRKGLSIEDIAYLFGRCRQTVQKAMADRGYDTGRKRSSLTLCRIVRRKR